jgi:hypothetical protein
MRKNQTAAQVQGQHIEQAPLSQSAAGTAKNPGVSTGVFLFISTSYTE